MSARSATRSIALAALLIALGNIASRILGLLRESVTAALFARGPAVDAYTAAWTIPNTIYDLLINGAISAALVPVLSEYAERDEAGFWRVAGSVTSIALLLLGGLALLLSWQSELAVSLLVSDLRPELRGEVARLMQPMLLAAVVMGGSGLLTAMLYARQRFLLPAFTATIFNAGVILAAVTLHRQFGILSLALGTLLGACLQVLLQLPGLRGAQLRLWPDWQHPGVRRILQLYAPVALGIGFSVVGTILDRRLASGLEAALSTMRYATTLIQFPLGLVAAAVSLAVLPTLSRQALADTTDEFRQTLAMGLKVVLLLVAPAAAGLAALATPVVQLIFQYGAFAASDSGPTALALLLYLPGMPAAALDQMLLFAFYARRRTLTPNLVQGVAILLYAITALTLIRPLGVYGLVIGNSVQWIGHALIMLLLTQRLLDLRGLGLWQELWRVSLASAGMALLVLGLEAGLQALGGPAASPLLLVLAGGLLGVPLYFGLCTLLGVQSLNFFVQAVRQRLARRRGPSG